MKGRSKRKEGVPIEVRIRNYAIVGAVGALALLGLDVITGKNNSDNEISPAQATLNAQIPVELIKFTEEQEAALRLTATAIVAQPKNHLSLLKQIPDEITDSLISYQTTSPDGINGSCSGNIVSLKRQGDMTTGAFITVGHCINSFLLAQGKGHTDKIFDTQISITRIEKVSPDNYIGNDPAVLVKFQTFNPFPTSLTSFPASRIGCKPNVEGNHFAAFTTINRENQAQLIPVYAKPVLARYEPDGIHFKNIYAYKSSSGGGIFTEEKLHDDSSSPQLCLAAVMEDLNKDRTHRFSPIDPGKISKYLNN